MPGYALLWPSILGLGWLLQYLLVADGMVSTEKEHLLRSIGEQYASYCQQTPRDLPKFKRKRD